MDDCWLVKVDLFIARSKVAERHPKSRIEDTMEKASKRADGNDLLNGGYVSRHSEGRYDVLIESVEDRNSSLMV